MSLCVVQLLGANVLDRRQSADYSFSFYLNVSLKLHVDSDVNSIVHNKLQSLSTLYFQT